MADNAQLADLRLRYRHLDSPHAPNWHRAIAQEMLGQFMAACCERLGVQQVRIISSHDRGGPARIAKAGRPDMLLDALRSATVVPANRRDPSRRDLCSDCSAPLDGNDRTYCRSCKSKRNKAEGERRRAGASASRGAPGHLGTFEEFIRQAG